ncbi:MAG TPA: enoyl-CoA hydratase [bacterium]|nr:enoyl-CoA hydratase [bacterium]
MTIEPEPPSPARTLLLTRRDGIVQVTLNRPEKLNALDRRLQTELTETLASLAADDTVRVLILTGAGRGFCAGLDLSDFQNSLTHFQEPPAEASVFQQLEAVPQPVIAAINGPAVTGGFELVLACDVLMASRAATFADTHALIGVPPGAGLSQKLSRIIGLPRAMALSLSGDFLDAETAYTSGLVSHLCEREALLPEAWALAERIAAAEPATVRHMKQLIRKGSRLPLGEALQLERDMHDAWAERADLDAVLGRRERVLRRNRGQHAKA